MSFSATDAAFEGFRLVRRNPLAIVIWSLLYLILSLANLFVSAGAMQSMVAMTEMMEGMEASPPTTLEGMMPMLTAYGQVLGQTAWLMPVSLVVGSVIYAAVARGVVNPQDKGLGFVRFGMDEVRVLVVSVGISLLSAVIYTAAFIGVFVLAGIAVATEQAWLWLFVVLGFFAAIAFCIWLAVRWSLAIPITVAEKRFAFFDSFALTKGRFWPLLGMAIIAGVMALVIWALSMIVAMPVSMMSGLSMMGTMGTTDDPTAVLKAFDPTNPWTIATAVLNAIVYALVVGVVYAPFAAAYRDIVGAKPSAAVFS